MAYYFRLPSLQELTLSQQAAINEPDQIALSGGPGTGKSVVSIYRHLTKHQNGESSLLLTYTTSLKRFLMECCRLTNQNAAQNVRTAFAGCPRSYETFSEVIIDEAQDLGSDYYERIKKFKVSYGADDNQILYPEHCSHKAELQERFPQNVDYLLDKNFRSTYGIMAFAKVAFPDQFITESVLDNLAKKNPGEKPSLIVTGGQDNVRDNAIKRIVDAYRSDIHNIAILVPFKATVREYDKILTGLGISHSMYYEDDAAFPDGCPSIDNVHVTTYKSAKGLEFDTVIIPDFGNRDFLCKNYPQTVSGNDFFVAVTRARTNLYLFSRYNIPALNSVVEK